MEDAKPGISLVISDLFHYMKDALGTYWFIKGVFIRANVHENMLFGTIWNNATFEYFDLELVSSIINREPI